LAKINHIDCSQAAATETVALNQSRETSDCGFKQAVGSRQYQTQMLFLFGFLLPATYCLLLACLRGDMIKAWQDMIEMPAAFQAHVLRFSLRTA